MPSEERGEQGGVGTGVMRAVREVGGCCLCHAQEQEVEGSQDPFLDFCYLLVKSCLLYSGSNLAGFRWHLSLPDASLPRNGRQRPPPCSSPVECWCELPS